MEKNLGHATAYGYAKSKGYSGTEDEFAELMADYASVGQSAAQSAEQAAASATSASASAQTASQAAQTATSKASEAVTAAGTATTKASEASQSASTASSAATSAGTSAQTATTAAATATEKASEASESATTATTAKTDAESARDAAAQSASEAAASAESIDPDGFDRKIYAAFVTDTATGAVASFPDGADSIPMKDVLVHIEPVQEGSGDPSPDNIRPITGWTGAKVTRTGKSLLPNLGPAHYEGGGISFVKNENGTVHTEGTATTIITYRFVSNANGFTLPAGEYAIINSAAMTGVSLTYRTTSGEGGYWYNTRASFTLNKATTYEFIALRIQTGTTINADAEVMIIPASDTDSTYEPYSGQTYDIIFPTEAGTVYGGTLDVTKGELVVDRAMVTLDGSNNESITNTIGEYTNTAFWGSYSSIGTKNAIFISDKLKTINPSFSSVSANLWDVWCSAVAPRMWFSVPKTLTTNEELRAYLAENPIIVVYPLASPITYQLTPQEITSLLGENNVWADTGNSDVTYCIDPTLLLDNESSEIQSIKSMIAGVESSAVATKNYSIGDLVIVGDTLYEVTAAIASGETISASKARVTTVDDVIRDRIADGIDATLTQSGQAADAFETGNKITSLKEDLVAYEELSVGYGVDRCNQDLVFGDRGQDGIFVASSSQLTTRKIIPVTPSTSYNISVYGAQLTGAIRYYKYSSTSESDFIGTGTKAVNADGTVTLPPSAIDANTNGIAFRTSQTALAGGSCRVVASDQLEPLYNVISDMLDTIDDRTEKTISSIAAETEQIAPDNGVMTRYPINGYINNDNGAFMANDRYVCYYFTAPIDTDMWLDNDIATWGQIAIYNGTMFDTASLVTIKSLSRNNLPYVDSKLAVASDMTVVVCVLATGSFRLHYYDIRITPEQIKSIVKPPIRIVPTSATAFSVYVLCETSGEYLRHNFNRITYTDNLTYGDGQTKSLVTCDVWYASNIYDTDGNMIMQGNTNFIQSLNIEGHTGHVGAGHGCVVADWTLFFADGQQFDPTTLAETIECTAFRFTEKATHYLRDAATSPSSAHSYPTLDSNGNPIPVSIEYLDGEWTKNNRIRIRNRLDIVYQDPFEFIQAHAGMSCGFYPYFSNVIFNNGEYLWNEFERDSGGTYSVSNPGGTTTLLPLGSVASIGGDRVIMFGDKYRVTKAMTLLNPNRYGKSNMLIQTPPYADDRIKAYLMPCICTQSSAMISDGQAVETFTNGDRLETLVDMQLDAVD